MTTEAIRTLIVDDESHARRTLHHLLERNPHGFLVQEACDGVEAMERIAEFNPELVLLDIEMPGSSGFDVLRAFPNRAFEVIFITAYANFAIQAFDACACDYLLKPVSPARFDVAIERAHERLLSRASRWPDLNRALLASHHYLDSLFIRHGKRASHVFCRDIVQVSASEGGVEIVTAEREFPTDLSLSYLEEHLDPAHFRRVHRNTIVHRRAIRKVLHGFPMVLELTNGTTVTVAKERRSGVRRWLEEKTP